MKLYIFNPEHDIALAENKKRFTPPVAGRQLASNLSFLPALWAQKGDAVLVDDKLKSIEALRSLNLKQNPQVFFLSPDDVEAFLTNRKSVKIQPWGWDRAIRETLNNVGVPEELLPSQQQLDNIRTLSSRSLAVKLLDSFEEMPGTTGFSRTCNTYEEVLLFLDNNADIVVKAPWSSSGRGIRYMHRDTVDENLLMWIVNTIEKQGSVVAEMKCEKVHDFAVEFYADERGKVGVKGLSVFSTERSAYKGNKLATEEEKRKWIAQYIPLELLDKAIKHVIDFMQENLHSQYEGPFGVDMMICSNPDADGTPDEPDYLLNPCIEINLRNTMGHVALALSVQGHRGFMNITYENKAFKLEIKD